MSKKAAIELSMNFLVIIILAIVILGFSFYLFFSVYGKAQELGELTQAQLNERVEELQCDGVVCISSNYQKLHRGKFHLFGVKITNTGEESEFIVNVEHVPVDEQTLNYVPKEYPITIGQNKEGRVGIGIAVPKEAASGIYIFNVDVTRNGFLYGTKQQIRVEVP